MKLARRRILAFGVDYLMFVIYAALLFFVVADYAKPLFETSPLFSELSAFGLVTLPMVIYYILTDASSRGGGLGKRLLGVRVVDKVTARRISYFSSLKRSVVKFLPWELGHFAVWNVFVFEASPLRAVGYAALGLCYGLVIVYMFGLLRGSGRTLYDLAAGSTSVVDRN